MEQELFKIRNDATSLIINADSEEELVRIKLDFLGKNGYLTKFIKELAKAPVDIRPEMGRLANDVKDTLEGLIDEKETQFHTHKKAVLKSEKIDITLPGIEPPHGHLHLITQAIEEITEIFARIGFERVRYPEVEWDYYAFTALNFPDNHPARDEWETFFVKDHRSPKYGEMILTPHTSSGQVRQMLKAVKDQSEKKSHTPVIKMLNIAKCYRRQSDISHTEMFHQFEGLVVGENIAITHLKGVLEYFVKTYFGEDRTSRIRPYQFQFTEPSFEVDVSVDTSVSRLGKEGWLELGGAGMVHPNVLKAGGIDPQKYSGFAFGWGVERVLMMKEGLALDDLRLLYSNNLDFLEQF